MRTATALIGILLAACSSSDPAGIETQAPHSIIVTPAFARLHIGEDVTLSATLLDRAGMPIAEPGDMVWHSADPSVAEVDQLSGHVTARGPGVALIEARHGTITRNAEITVVAPMSFGLGATAEKATPGRNGAPWVCTVALVAGSQGGDPGEYGTWLSGTVEVRRSDSDWQSLAVGPLEIADWFGTDRLYAGESRTGRATVSSGGSFDLAIRLRMQMPDGSVASDTDLVDCF